MPHPTLGVDIGGVIISRRDGEDDTSFFSQNFLKTPATEQAFETLRQLVDRKYGERVFIVSKCGEQTEQRTRLWLEHHRFAEITGITADRLHFCRERRDKAGICERLGVTAFIDDRLEILGSLHSVQIRYLFQPNPQEIRKFEKHLPTVRRVESWADVLQAELP